MPDATVRGLRKHESRAGRGAEQKQIPAPAALFGYSHLYGGVPGGQAEYVRVPKGNVGPFKVPQLLSDDKALFLSDILPTAAGGEKCADSERLQRRRIRGRAGGLLTIACARLLGAEQILWLTIIPIDCGLPGALRRDPD